MARSEKGTGTDLVPDKDDRPVDLEAVRQALLKGTKIEVVSTDPDVAQQAILERYLSAKTAEELFARSSVLQGKDLLDVGVRVDAVNFFPSDFEEGPPVYAVMRGTVLTEDFDVSRGELVAISIGGVNCVGQLFQAVAEGWIGDGSTRDLVIRQAKKATKRGFFPLWLEDWKGE